MDIDKIKMCSLSKEELAQEMREGKRSVFSKFNIVEKEELVAALKLAKCTAYLKNEAVVTDSQTGLFWFTDQYLEQKIAAALTCPELTKMLDEQVMKRDAVIKRMVSSQHFGGEKFSNN